MLREISILWSMVHTLVMFILLFESRYSKRTPSFRLKTVCCVDADGMSPLS